MTMKRGVALTFLTGGDGDSTGPWGEAVYLLSGISRSVRWPLLYPHRLARLGRVGSGHGSQCPSTYPTISGMLNREGVPDSRRGAAWHKSAVDRVLHMRYAGAMWQEIAAASVERTDGAITDDRSCLS
jgi:hypothetical protein